jgi:hypothetical protein
MLGSGHLAGATFKPRRVADHLRQENRMTEATGTDVATTGGAVPALAPTPAVEVTAEDVALPRLYLGQFSSEHVQEGRVPAGAVFTATGQEDPDPVVLWEQGGDDKPVVHILGMRKGKSITEGGELVLFAYDDPEAPADAWVTYNYVVAIPQENDAFPYKWLLSRTGKPTAQQINAKLVAAQNDGVEVHKVAFEVWCDERKNDKGKFFVPKIRPVEADEASTEVAARLAQLIQPDAPQAQGEAAPAI